MVQQTPTKWSILTEKDFVLRSDITISNVSDAEAYVRAYVSSFPLWNYELKPLKKD